MVYLRAYPYIIETTWSLSVHLRTYLYDWDNIISMRTYPYIIETTSIWGLTHISLRHDLLVVHLRTYPYIIETTWICRWSTYRLTHCTYRFYWANDKSYFRKLKFSNSNFVRKNIFMEKFNICASILHLYRYGSDRLIQEPSLNHIPHSLH